MITEKKRLLFVTTSYPRFEGDIAGSFLLPLVDKLRNDYNICVMFPSKSTDKHNNLNHLPFTYFFNPRWQLLTANHGIPEMLTSKPWLALQLPFLLVGMILNIIKHSKIADVVITNWLLPGGLAGAIASMLTKKPHIVICHSAGVHFLMALPFKKVLFNFILKHTSKMILVTPFLLEKLSPLIAKDCDKIEVIPLGVDLETFNLPVDTTAVRQKYGIPVNSKVVLFIGRITSIKGPDILIKALSGFPEITLVVVGRGENIDYYKKLAAENGVNAIFPPEVTGEQKIKLLKMADVVVVPSRKMNNNRTEGAPVVIIEAMAAGKIIVAARTGGIPLMIDDDVSGKLFEPENINALRQLLQQIFQDQHFYYKLATEAKKLATKYDINKVAESYSHIIRRLNQNE